MKTTLSLVNAVKMFGLTLVEIVKTGVFGVFGL